MAIATAPTAAPARPRTGRRDLLMVAAGVAVAGLYLLHGAGFVLDDWYFLRNAHFDGALHAAGPTGGDRPLGSLVYIALFGLIGPHPAPILLLLGLGNGVAAALLARVLRCWLPARTAGLIALLWVLLPLRTSLEAWMSTGTAVVATALTLAAVLLVTPERVSWRRLLGAALLLAAGTLTYEALVLLGLPVALAVRAWRDRRLDLRAAGALAALPLAALAWAYTHRLEGRHSPGGLRNPIAVVDANFGRGIAPLGLSALTLVAALAGTVLVLHRCRERPAGERWTPSVALVAVGWALVLWGVLPYLTYFYSPYGAGDRLNVLSAFGAVLVWGGLVAALPRPVGTAAAVALLGIGLVAREARTQQWDRAGRDGGRVVAAVVAAHPDPDRPILVGPAIEQRGVATFVDGSNVEAALQVAYDRRDLVARLAGDPATLAAVDPREWIVFDQRPHSELDDHPG